MVCITVSSLTLVQSQVRGRGGMHNSFVFYLSAKSSQREMVCITVSSPTSVQSQVRGRGGMYNSFVSFLSTKSSQRERWYV